MKIKFVIVINNAGEIINRRFGEALLIGLRTEFEEEEVESAILSELIDVDRMPKCLVGWEDYDRIIIICDAFTAKFFLDVYVTINNSELWIYALPCGLPQMNAPKKLKLFYYDNEEIIEEALSLAQRA